MLHQARDQWKRAEPTSAAPWGLCPAEGVEVELRTVRTLAPGLRHEWDELAQEASEPNCFTQSWFVAPSLTHLAPAGGVRLLLARRHDLLIGAGLFAVAPRYGRAPVRHVENWRHPNSFLGTPLVRRGEEAAFWQAALAGLDRAPWASGFLHVTGLVEDGPVHRGLIAAASGLGRGCPVVHRKRRPLLQTDLSPQAYFERNVGGKRRSEFRRLRKRLAELGPVEVRSLEAADDVGPWCEEFLALEASGWKGERGSALASSPDTAAFFRAVIQGAFAAGRLSFLRLDVGGQAVAMMSSLLDPPGAFGFKAAIDEGFARFSPGVLLQIDNLRILERSDISWTDSCATENHPVSSLWSEWRPLVRVSVRLDGLTRRFCYGGVRLLEEGARLASRHVGARG